MLRAGGERMISDEAAAPLVSLVTICRNAMPHIRTCVDSLLALDYPNVEIVVQDGGSTDGTLELLLSYGNRIRLCSQEDSGHGEAMTRALARCRGSVIGTCNADDLLMPHAATWAVEHLGRHPDAAAVYGDYCVIDRTGKVVAGPHSGPAEFRFDRVLCVEDVIPMQSSFFRKSSLEEAGLLSAGWMPKLCEDFLFWVSLGFRSPIKRCPGVVSLYRVHEGSGTFQPDLWARIYASKREVLERFFLRPDLPYELRSLRSRALGGLALSVASMFLVNFDLPAQAMEYVELARSEQPSDDHLDHMGTTIASWRPYLERYLRSVKEDLGRGDTATAMEKLRQMVVLDYWFPSVATEYARALIADGNAAEAASLLEHHVSRNPDDSRARNLLALCVAKVSRAPSGGTGQRSVRRSVGGLRFEWSSSRPRVDLILPGRPEQAFSWPQREGWAHALIEAGMLNNLYWVHDNERVIHRLFRSLSESSADFVLAMSCDHHMPFLQDTPAKVEFWRSLHIPVICHCAERIVNSPFPDSVSKTQKAIEAYDGFLYIDELAEALFGDKPAMWAPQYVDERLFRQLIPFAGRTNQVFFRGQLDNSGLSGVYRQRNLLIRHLAGDGNFCLSEAYRPMLTPAQAARVKAQYRFVLNAPANCSGYSASLYEALACGCAVFQYALPAEEVKSNRLFLPDKHFVLYDAGSPEEVAAKAAYACRHWRDYAAMAEAGMQECLARHTISRRLAEVVRFVEDNLQRLQRKPVAGYGLAAGDVRPVQNDGDLAVHFFTIVLNGEPFIRHHIDVFRALPFPWHWHIVEGVADLQHDTGWSLASGGSIAEEMHRNGLSCDGTSEYLDGLARRYPGQVSVYRKQGGGFWNGKVEMVNAPLERIRQECLLWQIDADELWSAEQIEKGRRLFLAYPDRNAAFYYCHFFVGPALVTATPGGYGNRTGIEWLRTWRFRPRDRWASHEPPRLCREVAQGVWRETATRCFTHEETAAAGLVFQHYAYATLPQVRFKERYYGYRGACEMWRKLNSATRLPVRLADYFAWVDDDTAVTTAASRGIVPLATLPHETVGAAPVTRILWIRPDSIGDNVLAASMLPHLRARYPQASITVFCQHRTAEIYKASPFVSQVIGFDMYRAHMEERYRESIARRLRAAEADLALYSLYSRDPLYDWFAAGCGAKERIAMQGDLSNIAPRDRDANNGLFTCVVPSAGKMKPELARHRDFLRGIGVEAPPLMPTLWLTDDDHRHAEAFFRAHNLRGGDTVALFAGAQSPLRAYAHYGRALAELCGKEGLTLVALGAGCDREINQANLDQAGARGINLSGKLTLRQSAAILKRCRLAVGAETGLAHIACAVGTPNVVLLGGGHFARFMPYSPLTSVACLPLACYSCNWRCRYARAHCVKDLHPVVLKEAVREALAGPSEAVRVYCQSGGLWRNLAEEPQWAGCKELLRHHPVTMRHVETDAGSGREPRAAAAAMASVQARDQPAAGWRAYGARL